MDDGNGVVTVSLRTAWRTAYFKHRFAALLLPLLGWCAACAPGHEEDVASVTVELSTVPNDVACVRITAAGATRTATATRGVVPGRQETLALNGLPVGVVTFTGEAFGTPCAAVNSHSVPTWISEPVKVTLSVSEITAVSLLLRRNGRASVSIGFDDQDLDEPPTPGALAYVTDQGCLGAINIIDIDSNTVVDRIDLPTSGGASTSSYQVTFSPDGARAYASATYSGPDTQFQPRGELLVLDVTTRSLVATVALDGFPFDVVVSSSGERVYVTTDAPQAPESDVDPPGHVMMIDVAARTVVGTVEVGPVPRGLAQSPDGTQLYVLSPFENTLSVIDVASWALVEVIPLDLHQPQDVVVSPDGALAYVLGNPATSAEPSVIAVVDLATASPASALSFGGPSQQMLLSPDGQRLYVTYSIFDPSASDFVGHVATIDLRANAVIGDVLVGSSTFGLALTPDGRKLYVGTGADSLVVIDTRTNVVTATVSQSRLCPYGIAIAN